MELTLAIIVGFLYAAGIYLIMMRSLVKLILGLIMIGNGANLLIFLLGGLVRGTPPVVGAGEVSISGVYADPVPQALILTAIVISFGIQSFAIILIRRAYKVVGTDDIDDMKSTDELE